MGKKDFIWIASLNGNAGHNGRYKIEGKTRLLRWYLNNGFWLHDKPDVAD